MQNSKLKLHRQNIATTCLISASFVAHLISTLNIKYVLPSLPDVCVIKITSLNKMALYERRYAPPCSLSDLWVLQILIVHYTTASMTWITPSEARMLSWSAPMTYKGILCTPSSGIAMVKSSTDTFPLTDHRRWSSDRPGSLLTKSWFEVNSILMLSMWSCKVVNLKLKCTSVLLTRVGIVLFCSQLVCDIQNINN